MEDRRSITLDTKPGASLRLSVYSSTPPRENNPLSDVLVVFLNGLVLPRAAWSDAISYLIDSRTQASKPMPTLLTYDRYGQGESDSDPTDPPDTPYGHDADAVVSDLGRLLTQFAQTEKLERLRLIFVCNSIGCPLARLYAASHHADRHQVSAFLFLDSMMANTDFVSLFPDPDAEGFDPEKQLPQDVSPEDLRHARDKFGEYFHPAVPNPERFDRRNLAKMLPHSDKPQLPPGPGGQPPRLVVIGHDWDEFAEQCEKVRTPENSYQRKNKKF